MKEKRGLGNFRGRPGRSMVALFVVALVAVMGLPANAADEPVLVSTHPTNNSRVKSADAVPLKATYDKDLDPLSTFVLSDRLLQPLSGSGSLDGPISETGGQRSIRFDPDAALSEQGSPYKATVTVCTAPATACAAGPGSTTTVFLFTIDDTAPDRPVILTPAEGATERSSPVKISGTAEPNTTVTVRNEDGTILGSPASSAAGSWSIDVDLADGSYEIDATARDAAGDESIPSEVRHFSVDVDPPPPPVIARPAEGAIESNATFAITGTTEIGSTVTVYRRGTGEAIPAVTDQTGGWSTAPVTFHDGRHTIYAVARDVANKESDPSPDRKFRVEAHAPAAPTITAPQDGAALGSSEVTIEGGAEPDSIITIYEKTENEWHPIATAATGEGEQTWSTRATLPDGKHTIRATATDVLGRESGPSVIVTFTVDTRPPPAPVIARPAEQQPIVDSTSVVVAGSAEPGSSVTVYRSDNDEELATAEAGQSGSWETNPIQFAQGEHRIYAVATDEADKRSDRSAVRTFTVDTLDPNPPVIELPEQGTVLKETKVVIEGVAEADAVVTVEEAGAPIAADTADGEDRGNGLRAWSVTVELPDGPHTVRATARDRVGHDSDPSAPRSFTVDANTPPPPVIVAPAEGATLASSSVTISGRAEAGTTVTVRRAGTAIGTAPADGSGNWSMTKTFADGPHTISATATDGAGRESVPVSRSFSVDTRAPVIESPTEGAALDNPSVPITGTAPAGTTVTVWEKNTSIAVTAADNSGRWNTAQTFADGTHVIYATATDLAEHKSAPSANRTFTVDTVRPPPPAIAAPAEGSAHGRTVTMSGTAEPGATVAVFDGTNPEPIVTTLAGGNETWSAQYTYPAGSSGNKTIRATATDRTGNKSAPSAPRSFSVDATAPGRPIIERPGTWSHGNEDGTGKVLIPCTEANWDQAVCTAGPRYTVTGKADEANVTITVREIMADGSPVELGATRSYAEPAVPGSTPVIRWALTLTFTKGKHTINAIATDDFGNSSDPSQPNCVFNIDASSPSPPVISSPADGAQLKSASVNLYGTAEPRSVVTVREGTATVALASTSPFGDWSVEHTFTDGKHTIAATAADPYGNESNSSALVGFTIDANAPSQPVITSPAAGATVGFPTTLAGTAEPGSAVTVRENGVALPGTPVTAAANGSWSVSVALSEGSHTISATATDAAGNESAPSADTTFTVVLDPALIPPAAPEIGSPVEGAVHGPSVTVSGTAEADTTVEVTENGVPLGTAPAGAEGTWSMNLTFANGAHAIRATATDSAGNESLPSAVRNFTVDANAPGVMIATPNNTQFGPATPVTITGTASDDRAVQSVAVVFTDAAGTPTTVPANYNAAAGTWSATTNSLLPGQYAVVARATDAAGNVGTSPSITIVTLGPPSLMPVPTALPSL